MSKPRATYRHLEADSKILAIGSLFRSVNRKSWAINLDFNGKKSNSLQFSAIPILARKRVLNATEPHKSSGKPFSFTVSNAQAWRIEKASSCQAYKKHFHGKDYQQLCFVAQVGETKVYIPQLEMARVLFYHDPFLARLSLQHNALSEDFILDVGTDGQHAIVVREGAEYPISYFNQEDNRRFLSWVLLDREARASFESISSFLIKESKERNGYHHWDFQFTPPSLANVELGVRGWSDIESNTFFVWEVTRIENLPSDVQGEINFHHPKFERKVPGKPSSGGSRRQRAPEEYEIDDEEISDVDKATVELESEPVSISFKNPFITNRIPVKDKPIQNSKSEGEEEVADKKLSPNEKDEEGSLQGGNYNNLDDKTDDAHLYLGKFKSFLDMVDVLVANHKCELKSKSIVKLPKVGDSEKHRLTNHLNPRCLAFVELKYKKQEFALLEVDTSDGAAKMSTMLLASSKGWVDEHKSNIGRGLILNSLSWPTSLFKDNLGERAYKGIPHPKSEVAGKLLQEEISPWALRVFNWMKSCYSSSGERRFRKLL